MVLSNKRKKERLRSELAQPNAHTVTNGSFITGQPRSLSANKRERKRQRLQQARNLPAPQPGSPATAIDESELDTYNRCIEALLHRNDDAQNVLTDSRPNQRQEDDIVPNALEGSAFLPGLDKPNSPLSNAKSMKRKKTKERYVITKQEEGMTAIQSLKDMESSDPRTVYVGGIPYYSSEDDIKAFFGDCGTICDVNLKTFKDSGKFRGIALLTFKTVGGAERALALDGANMGDRYLKIKPDAAKSTEHAKRNKAHRGPPSKVQGYTRAYIGNLAWSVTEEDIRALFRDCKVDSVRFSQDKTSGDFQGYGHVDFGDDESLELALQKDQAMLLERPIKVAYAVPQQGKAGSSKDVTCYACGDKGHLSSRCPRMGRA